MPDRAVRPRLVRLAIAAATVVAALAGCASIPTSGAVNQGAPESTEQAVDVDILPRGPREDANQQQILDGFIDAAASPSGNYEIARQFLTPDFSDEWESDAAVSIDVLADRSFTQLGDDLIRMRVVPQASLAENGQYIAAGSTEPVQLEYRFEQVDGQWRISFAPPGVLIDETSFGLVYRDYSLAYFDPQFRYVVPDVRWFAGRDSLQTSIVRALLEGPVEWLDPGVASAFPEDVELGQSTVPVTGGTATVDLRGAAFDNIRTIQLMQYQLEQSLLGVRNVDDVSLTLNGVPLSAPDTSDLPERTLRVDSRPAVYDGEAFGYLSSAGEQVAAIEGVSDQVVALGPMGAALGSGATSAAVLAEDGVHLVRSGAETVLLDPRDGLITPVLDVDGTVWSVPRDAPDELAWFASDGSSAQIAVPWSVDRIVSLQLSRDGTRMAALLVDGSRTRLVAASVVRGDDGVPVELGAVTLELAVSGGTPLDVAWLDSRSVGTLTRTSESETRLTVQELGTPADYRDGPPFGIQVDGANSLRDLRILTSDGDLATGAGVGWQVQARDLRFLVTQQTD
ncbi:LpqB family beta-propeller domain-containing protein [Agromyces sp. SYSU T00266]|uniref:LpqB family beta-propeller domain-containing protein n=1 Tax=Agromyces zhanjiangensis TaxID=3158562 RepID=UPI0033958DAA